MKNVVLLGASNKTDRYSYKVLHMLIDYGYHVIPINPILDDIDGVAVKHSLSEVSQQIHTVTLYLNPSRLEPIIDEIIMLKPKRIIFNPGTESPEAKERMTANGIETVEACTLVMLRTGQF
jgi:uncharacterized protein